ncbi:MAG: glutamine amidotransferase family protein [Bacillota bacterium]|nr:glutamine amidotransferase family protein [Bacillota bacterium]MDW7684987.1 glutamine amidotransferase family protein [Bacillota bacterium]
MCGIAGLISQKRVKENGRRIKNAIVLQNDRGNGLGAGYAAYGIYPGYEELYALLIMASSESSMEQAGTFIRRWFTVHKQEPVPVWDKVICDHPYFQRFFVEPGVNVVYRSKGQSDDDFVVEKMMELNKEVYGAYACSTGRDMGVFKGVGTPLDIYEFFMLDQYEGYSWLAHNRFPTNTPGWWGGAHPFNAVDWSIVHNGEISSYGINRRYLESHGYFCHLQTDSEVIAYLFDLLIRRHGLSITEATTALAPPYWATVERLADSGEKERLTLLKVIYEQAMLNGPFAVLIGFSGGMFSLTDNTKLRPMTTATQDGYTYFASEVSALYEMNENLAQITTPRAGQPVIALYENE